MEGFARMGSLDPTDPVILGFLFVFGALFGSFLNVVVYRLPREIDIFVRRSFCPECDEAIPWYRNVPLVSWIVQLGRCAECGSRIPARYPLVELTTAVLFVAAAARWGYSASAVAAVVFASAMLVLALIDLDHQILPNVITLPGIAVGVAFSLVDPRIGWLQSILGAIVGGGSLYAVAWLYWKVRSREGMGMGDVKMMAMVGAFLGWQGAFLTIFIGSLLGSVVGVAVVSIRDQEWEYALPFGTFLALAAVAADWFGAPILTWYWGLMGPVT